MRKWTLLKQRFTLGFMLLCIAILATWAARRLVQEPHMLFIVGDPIELQESVPVLAPNVVGAGDVTFASPPQAEIEMIRQLLPRPTLQPLSAQQVEGLSNFNYLTNRIFLVDPETILLPSDINVQQFLEADLTIDTSTEGPLVLIFHTHSAEMFIDSNPTDPMTGVMGVGRYLAEILTDYHGLEVLHHTGRFDFIDGRSNRLGSYERMEPVIRQILADNPSIQVVIDLHRDGVLDHVPAFVHYVDGMPTAQIMFFNGLSRQNRNGQPVTVYRLPNPYQQQNLNFSFQMQLAANQLYPGLARRIYLRAFRYSLHMAPLSTLVEVGNQHNTLQQAKNAMYPLANIIAAVVLE